MSDCLGWASCPSKPWSFRHIAPLKTLASPTLALLGPVFAHAAKNGVQSKPLVGVADFVQGPQGPEQLLQSLLQIVPHAQHASRRIGDAHHARIGSPGDAPKLGRTRVPLRSTAIPFRNSMSVHATKGRHLQLSLQAGSQDYCRAEAPSMQGPGGSM